MHIPSLVHYGFGIDPGLAWCMVNIGCPTAVQRGLTSHLTDQTVTQEFVICTGYVAKLKWKAVDLPHVLPTGKRQRIKRIKIAKQAGCSSLSLLTLPSLDLVPEGHSFAQFPS